jgi:alkyl sulfatase BDS1-like metallo-beta-lactamase superfamily hydrolase
VARYLTPEWFEELNSAARSDEVRAAAVGARLSLQQIVTGGPGGDVRYWVRLDDGTVEAGLGDAEDRDATVTQSWDTAVAVMAGDLDVQTALMRGQVRISGNVAPLIEAQAAMEAVTAAFQRVRQGTSYG